MDKKIKHSVDQLHEAAVMLHDEGLLTNGEFFNVTGALNDTIAETLLKADKKHDAKFDDTHGEEKGEKGEEREEEDEEVESKFPQVEGLPEWGI
jgi:hypothetical protein